MTPEAAMSCPLCRAGGPFDYLETYHDPIGAGDYRIHRCGGCGVIFAQPFAHPGAEWYARFSSADSYEGSAGWRFDWFLESGFGRGGRLLDVGCGTGAFLARAKAAGYDVEGVDVNPEAVAEAKARGLDARLAKLEDFAKKVPPASFDVVTMFDVLEHFDNPREMTELAASLLKPGGGLVVTTPNGLRPVPFGRDDFDYPPHHLTRWTPAALERFLRARGFRVAQTYHTYLPTWEFSRFLVTRATRAAVGVAKRVFFGRGGDGATLTRLVEEKRGIGLAPAVLGDKSRRVRVVRAFQSALGAVLAPVFLPMKLYYRLTAPGVGVTSCVLAVKI